MLYCLARPLLFSLDPETAHDLTIHGLAGVARTGLLSFALSSPPKCAPHTVMGLTFPNPVGLAAGLDKNGECIQGLAALGFGFIEIGTVTPRPQPGNPKPRMFRLPEVNALINRLGFNNHGVDQLIENVQRANYQGILGINIGKNFDTPIEHAAEDYLACIRKVYPYASYVTLNISSPNTQNLRELQGADALDALLTQIKSEQARLADQHGKYVPLALKIAPDLDDAQIQIISERLLRHKIDAVIATNTTLARDAVTHLPHGNEAGGLSGAPVKEKSTAVIRALHQKLGGALPIIGVGGILNGSDAREKIDAGAQLVQIYTGLIYRGPDLVPEAIRALCAAKETSSHMEPA